MIVESYEDVIILSGSIESNHWETLQTAISLTLKRHPSGVVIDVSQISRMNQFGADTFRSVMEYIHDHDARVIVAAVPDHVMSVLKSVPDVRSQLPIVKTVEEARASLDLLGYEDEAHDKKSKGAPKSSVMVVLNGTACDQYVIETATELAESLKSGVNAIYPLIVPRDMPLQAPMPEDERSALKALNAAEALLDAREVHHQMFLERGRDLGSAIASALEEHPGTHVLIGVPECKDETENAGKVVNSVLAKVKSAVIFIRGPVS